MKFLLKLLVVAASLIGIVLVIAFFVDRSFEVKRSKKIPANHQDTFNYLKTLENQEEFNAWLNLDPNTKVWYEGNPGEMGYKMCWQSSDSRVGKGTQEIVAIEENERIEYALTMVEPDNIRAHLTVHVKEYGRNESRVTWHMKGEIPYPWNLSLLFKDIEEQIGMGFEKSMENISPIVVQSNE